MIPRILYGTAWKEDATEALTAMALSVGYRAIDTANQRKHYVEEAVGRAIRAVPRDTLFLQTKFTFAAGQDHRLPYPAHAPVAEQVARSFDSSLAHLGTDLIDSYVLHGPSQRVGLGDADWSAWRAMEALADAGRVRFLGVSNVTAAQLDALCLGARIRPTFVQNRCYARLGWDRDVRAVCARHGVTYQAFSLLTANIDVLDGPACRAVATRYRLTPAQTVFALAVALGMLPLTGSTSAAHLREDLAALDVVLDRSDVARLAP